MTDAATASAALREPRLDDDDFALFGLPRRQAQDLAEIDRRWKALQTQVHPDRHAAAGAAAQRLAMQWAVRVNEAHQRLKDPLRRAALLCELHGEAVNAENNTAMPPAFLMQQMAWREALDDARDMPALEALADEVVADERQRLAELTRCIDGAADWPAAAQAVRALMFVRRFAQDVDTRLAALDG